MGFKRALIKICNTTYSISNIINLKRKDVLHGRNLYISGRIKLHGSGRIIIGDNVSINSSPNVNPVACGNETHLRAEGNGVLKIGNRVGISHSAITAMESVVIEDNVLIGSNCIICDTDFHSIDYEHRMEKPDNHIKTAPVVIKEGAFIGARCIILKGVTIGRHSVVGADSVVTKNIPDNEIWAGNPAVFIKIIGGGYNGTSSLLEYNVKARISLCCGVNCIIKSSNSLPFSFERRAA